VLPTRTARRPGPPRGTRRPPRVLPAAQQRGDFVGQRLLHRLLDHLRDPGPQLGLYCPLLPPPLRRADRPRLATPRPPRYPLSHGRPSVRWLCETTYRTPRPPLSLAPPFPTTPPTLPPPP